MSSQSDFLSPAPTRWRRVLAFPLVQIVLAIVFIAVPFAIVSTPFNLFVTDKPLHSAVLLQQAPQKKLPKPSRLALAHCIKQANHFGSES